MAVKMNLHDIYLKIKFQIKYIELGPIELR